MHQSPRGWHSRGYLPHFDGRVTQFVTFRLFDSLPQKLLHQLKIESELGKLDRQDREFQIKVEHYLDQGIGSCYLRQPKIAEMVQQALLYYDQERVRLIEWVIMLNHVHLLIRPNGGTRFPR